MIYKNVTGIILSGGRSSRMGENKAFLELNGKSIIEVIISKMKNLFEETLIISNEPELYKQFNLPVFEDKYKYLGPLAGIHSGLSNSSNQSNLIISCDLPLVSKKMIKYLIEFNSQKEVILYKYGGKIHYSLGFFTQRNISKIEKILSEYDEKLHPKKALSVFSYVMNEAEAEIIDADDLDFIREENFLNVNKPADFLELKKKRYKFIL